MTTEARAQHVPLNTYHANSSLLYQFILSEFLITYGEIKTINGYVGQLSAESKRALTKKEYEKLLAGISKSITKLAGSSQEYMRLFTWNLAEGAVAKLKNYCAYLSEQEEREDDRLVALHRAANRTWLLCLHGIDLLRNLQRSISSNKKQISTEEIGLKESLCVSLEKMSHHVRRFARLIAQVTYDFKKDENILYFLLRHKKEFDELYGKQFTYKLINKMYPKGKKQLERYITKKYVSRGFSSLIPALTHAIDELYKDD